MEIRPAHMGELARIMQLYAEGGAYMRENGNPAQWAGGYPSVGIVREDIAAGRLYAVWEEGEMLAVFCYFYGEDATYAQIDGTWLNDAPYGVIHRIAVGANAHRRGIASRCFSFALARCGNLKIDTHRDNIPMQRTLAKNGFTYCGLIRLEDGSLRMAYQKEISD